MNSNNLVGGKHSLAVFLSSLLILSIQLSTNDASILKIASGIIVTGFLPVVEVLIAFACLFGAGYLLSLALLKANDRVHLRVNEFLLLCTILGAMLISGLLFLLGLAGILYTGLILTLKVIFSLVGARTIAQIVTKKILLDYAETISSGAFEKVLSSALAFFILLVLICAEASPGIHGDAMQYHYALPWQYLQKHSIEFYQTIPGSGQYNAGDLLYLLTIKVEDPWNIFSTNLFNACLECLLFVAIFVSVKRNNVTSYYAYLACILLLSVPAIRLWGNGGKNDLLIAGLCLSTIWMYRLYTIYKSDRWLYTTCLLGGFAVSVKILAAPVIIIGGAMLLIVFLKRKLGLKKYIGAVAVACIPVVPWILYAYVYRGNPVYPMGESIFNSSGYLNSAYYLAAATARNASGLKLSIENFFGQFFPLLTGASKFGSGTYTSSLGYIFIASLVVGALYIDKKNVREYSYYYFLGAINLLVFYVIYFETWIQMRYMLFSAPAIFVFFVSVIANANVSVSAFQKTMHIVVVIFAFASGPMLGVWQSLKADQNRVKYLSQQISRDEYIKTSSGVYEQAYSVATMQMKPGEKVLINDSMNFGLNAEFINIHSLHSDYIRYDKIDALQFEKLMQKDRVSVAIIRPGISGIAPQLQVYLKNNMNLKYTISPYEIYVLKEVI